MEARFDTEAIRLINFFEEITGAPVKDCMVDEEGKTIYYVIEQGKVGMAIGKNGNSVKHAENVLKKSIRVFEFSPDIESFVKNVIPHTIEIRVRQEGGENIVEIRVDRSHRSVTIGRDGRNIKLFKELLQRNHNIRDLIVR
jgi:N utilization substance protein A